MNTNQFLSFFVTYILVHLATGILGYLRLCHDVLSPKVHTQYKKILRNDEDIRAKERARENASIFGVRMIIFLDCLVEGPYALRWYKGFFLRFEEKRIRARRLKLLRKIRKLRIRMSELRPYRK